MVMKVLLFQDVSGLGYKGDLVSVKPGYAMNFLFPQRKAVLASEANMRRLKVVFEKMALQNAKDLEHAQVIAKKMEEVELTFSKKTNDKKKLFGSVTASDIADSLRARGFTVERRNLQMPRHLNELGQFDVSYRVYRDVKATFPVKIEAEVPVDTGVPLTEDA